MDNNKPQAGNETIKGVKPPEQTKPALSQTKESKAIDTLSRITQDAVYVILGALNSGKETQLANLSPTVNGVDGNVYSAVRDDEAGTVTLTVSPQTYLVDAARSRLSQVRDELASAKLKLQSAVRSAETQVVGDKQRALLQASVDKAKAAWQSLEDERVSILAQYPCLERERLEQQADFKENQAKRFYKDAENLVKNAAEWRAKPEPKATVGEDVSKQATNESRAKECERRAKAVQAKGDDLTKEAHDLREQGSKFAPPPVETKTVFKIGQVVGFAL